MWPLWIGSFVVGAVLALASYPPTYWAVARFRARIALRRARRAERKAIKE
jgi:uncharacterized protein (DUF2062 family)